MDEKIHKMRGIAYLNWGKYREAINDFDESIKLDPNDFETRQGREEAYMALNSNMSDYMFIMPPLKLHETPTQQTVKNAKKNYKEMKSSYCSVQPNYLTLWTAIERDNGNSEKLNKMIKPIEYVISSFTDKLLHSFFDKMLGE